MNKIRRLQFIGKQHLLNIPANVVSESNWQKGDYIAVMQRGNNSLEIKKVAEKDIPRAEVILAELQQEAANLFALIHGGSEKIESAEFSFRLSQFSHIEAKIRKLKQKMNTQK